nr:MAG TPA: bacterial xenogeneic silencer-like protein [Caudoviricetes sp.]
MRVDMEKISKELQNKSFMVATSKEFYKNPQNGEYVEEVIRLEDALRILSNRGDSDAEVS